MSPRLHVWVAAIIVLALWMVAPASGEAHPLDQSFSGGTVPPPVLLPVIHTAPRAPHWEWEVPSGPPYGYALNSVWGSAPNDVFFVGNGGHIVHYDGTTRTGMA